MSILKSFCGLMIIPLVENFRRIEVTEVKTFLESSEFGNFGRFYVRWKVWFIGVVILNQRDYLWLHYLIVL
ncbi:hypothetical protein EBU71_17270 [bacterium]|nr:hypothetical protein [Candidatus Elulimicrobium humile]